MVSSAPVVIWTPAVYRIEVKGKAHDLREPQDFCSVPCRGLFLLIEVEEGGGTNGASYLQLTGGIKGEATLYAKWWSNESIL